MMRGAVYAATIAPLFRSFPLAPPLTQKKVVGAVTPLGATVTATVTLLATVTAPLPLLVTAPGVVGPRVTAPGGLLATVTASGAVGAIVTASGVRAGVRRMGKKAGKGKEGKGPVSGGATSAPQAPLVPAVTVTEGLGPVPPCLRVTRAGDVSIAIHAKPRSKQAAVSNVASASVGVAIDAPAREGEANDALLDFLAQVLHLKKRQLSLQAGSKSREKVVVAQGCTIQEVHRALVAAQDD